MLAERFDQFENEARNQAMLETWAFRRMPNESVDEPIPRFETLRTRAVTEGHYNMSIEGWSNMRLQECPLVADTTDPIS